MADYDIDISDFDELVNRPVTRKDIIRLFNAEIRTRGAEAYSVKGIEVDIPFDWEEALLREYRILDEYKKMGWKVLWFQKHSDGPGRGQLIRSWVSFWSPNAKKER